MGKQIAIIHFNTPLLTEACILSIRKSGCDWPITVLDNSDERPLKKKMKNVRRIDNTRGQVIDFDRWLEAYPDKCYDMARLSNYGSAKHIMSVQYLWDVLPEGFILVESDVLIRRDIRGLWREEYAAVGRVQWHQPGNRADVPRLLPWLCYMNVPVLTKHGARYFDPQRCWALQAGGKARRGNWYDTGAALLEDIMKMKPHLVARNVLDLDTYYDHYRGGSWRGNDVERQKKWLEERKEFF